MILISLANQKIIFVRVGGEAFFFILHALLCFIKIKIVNHLISLTAVCVWYVCVCLFVSVYIYMYVCVREGGRYELNVEKWSLFKHWFITMSV